MIESIGEPVFLLGHSYGAQTALAAAVTVPHRVRKLVLYEAAWPRIIGKRWRGSRVWRRPAGGKISR